MRQYTGALVGLGYDPRTGEALLPDHDSELVFEVEITEDDIIGVGTTFDINILYRVKEKTPLQLLTGLLFRHCFVASWTPLLKVSA